VFKTLTGLGFSEADAQVYVFLSKKGLQRGRDVAKALKMNKQQLYPCLKNLQSKGIVSVTLEHPARFSAVPFESVLDLFVKAKMDEAQRIQQSKADILSDWQSIVIGATDEASARFMVLEGRTSIYSKIQQMTQESKKQLLTMTTIPGLVQADQFGLFDSAYDHLSKFNIQFRFLTELNEQNISAMKNLIGEMSKAKIIFQGRNPYLGLRSFPRLIVKDEDEILLFIKPATETSKLEEDDSCLWTNCKTLINGFTAIFEELWRNSTDIQKKLTEIEGGKLAPKTYTMADSRKAENEYTERVQAAKEEIVILTSTQGLLELWKNKNLFEKINEKGVPVKIMAPVVRENLEAAEQLSKYSEVRHVPVNYVGVTIVDRQNLFQFKVSSANQLDLALAPHFYTDDLAYVEKMRHTLNDIWKNAQVPSANTLESITGPYGLPIFPLPRDNQFTKATNFPIVDVKPPGIMTEKDILNKITNAKKYPVKDPSKDLNVMYASAALGVIHPPDYFNLPDMLFIINHIEKQSSFGEADVLEVHLWLETPKDRAFVAAGGLGDNPRGVAFRKAFYAGTPFEQNYQLVKKDKLQVRVFGNTLFAGWTVPIPLLPPKYVLPPGCIMFEGHGNVKTEAFTYIGAQSVKCENEQNWFDAFVTFMHPASKYSGPGTDGCFVRDLVLTMTPLQKNGH